MKNLLLWSNGKKVIHVFSKAIFKIPCYCLENKWHKYVAEFMSSNNNHNDYGCSVLLRVVDNNTYLYLFIFVNVVLSILTFLCTYYKISGIIHMWKWFQSYRMISSWYKFARSILVFNNCRVIHFKMISWFILQLDLIFYQ